MNRRSRNPSCNATRHSAGPSFNQLVRLGVARERKARPDGKCESDAGNDLEVPR
jgi:hypothetical protein